MVLCLNRTPSSYIVLSDMERQARLLGALCAFNGNRDVIDRLHIPDSGTTAPSRAHPSPARSQDTPVVDRSNVGSDLLG